MQNLEKLIQELLDTSDNAGLIAVGQLIHGEHNEPIIHKEDQKIMYALVNSEVDTGYFSFITTFFSLTDKQVISKNIRYEDKKLVAHQEKLEGFIPSADGIFIPNYRRNVIILPGDPIIHLETFTNKQNIAITMEYFENTPENSREISELKSIKKVVYGNYTKHSNQYMLRPVTAEQVKDHDPKTRMDIGDGFIRIYRNFADLVSGSAGNAVDFPMRIPETEIANLFELANCDIRTLDPLKVHLPITYTKILANSS